jgi:myosin heavy subunit
MPDVQCANPKCQKLNPAGHIFCRFCGLRLPQAPSGPSVLPGRDVADLQSANQQLQTTQDQLAADHMALTSQHQQLQVQHTQLQDQHDTLQALHGNVVEALTDVQQQKQQTETQKQEAEGKIQLLLSQVKGLTDQLEADPGSSPAAQKTIADLRQKLLTAEKNLQAAAVKINNFEASPAGQLTRPLWSKLLAWGLLPVLGSVGGVLFGIHTPSGQKGQFKQQLVSTQKELDASKKQLEAQGQQLAAEQHANADLTSQMADIRQGAQGSSGQLAATQAELSKTKGSLTKNQQDVANLTQRLKAEQVQSEHLSVKAAQAAALQSVIDHHPYVNYKGPAQGTVKVKYVARNDKPGQIEIDHFSPSGDSDSNIDSKSIIIKGDAFPSVPFIVEPVSKNVAITVPPSASNNWQKLRISVQGKGKKEITLRWSVF